MWVTGFTDAEGSFIVSIGKRSGTNWLSFQASFEIGLHSKDSAILQDIYNFFKVGQVTMRKTRLAVGYSVSKIADLTDVIIPHFTKYSLQSQKRVDFEVWVQIVKIIAAKEHLTESGLLKMLTLKTVLNRGLTEATRSLTNKKIETLVRPLHLANSSDFAKIDPYWISGFTAGDGSFSIRTVKSTTTYHAGLRFRITQHIRDAHLLGLIAEYLGCGKVYTRANKLACDLEVFTFNDNFQKIIPFFKKFPIRTVKEKDFKDFCTIADMLKNKEHSTPQGLALIKDIKSKMNNFR